jgi:SlyX protein
MQERITELEKKAAFQEDLIQQLNSVLLEQQRKIELLEKRFNAFKDQPFAGDIVKQQEYEEPPPHY